MSADRETNPQCPSCAQPLSPSGTRLQCNHCNGMLVRPQELEEMLNNMAPDQPRTLAQLMKVGGKDTPRKCPSCDKLMAVMTLASVTVDQCVEHGIWFDSKELTRALEAQGYDFASRQWDPRSLEGKTLLGTPTIFSLLADWWHSPKKPKDS